MDKDVNRSDWSSMTEVVARLSTDYARDVRQVWGKLIEQHNSGGSPTLDGRSVRVAVLPVDDVKRLFVHVGDVSSVERAALRAARSRMDRETTSFLASMDAPETYAPAFR